MEKKRIEFVLEILVKEYCSYINSIDEVFAEKLKDKDLVFLKPSANDGIIELSSDIVADFNGDKSKKIRKNARLESVFNIINEVETSGDTYYLDKSTLDSIEGINFPHTEKSEKPSESSFYEETFEKISSELVCLGSSKNAVNYLLSVFENNLSFVPAATEADDNNISAYDRIKMCAMIGTCIKDYTEEKNVALDQIHNSKPFILYSMDISGIQDFIYTISSKGALKGLRARSFYLEILMEHIVDEFLEEFALSRVNLMYIGGGNCYMILPNTQAVISKIDASVKRLNDWFIDKYGISLYMTAGRQEAGIEELSGKNREKYSNLYKEVSRKISERKSHRYTFEEIKTLNSKSNKGKRECVVCQSMTGAAGSEDEVKCFTCRGIEDLSGKIIRGDYFVISEEPLDSNSLELPFGKYLDVCKEEDIDGLLKYDLAKNTRVYVKNKIQDKIADTELWVGTYVSKERQNIYAVSPNFKDLSAAATGIDKIAVLRADIDNLGAAFVSGFGDKSNISRTASLSRQLSLFFKYHINEILANPVYRFSQDKKTPRAAVIVYSGGDDVFIVGAWDDIIGIAIDVKNALKKFTCGKLTISAGIGIYDDSFPINVMAKEVEELENNSKNYEHKDEKTGTLSYKNAVTLFEEAQCYNFDEFEYEVLGEKFQTIKTFFDNTEVRGSSFLYRMLELIRDTGEKINIARFVYLISRLEPKADSKEYGLYMDFSKKLYNWIQNDNDKKQLITAIYIYIYLNRK